MLDRLIRGQRLVQSRRFDLAEREFREALRSEPDNATVLANLAHCLSLLKKFDEAIELAAFSLKLDPSQPLAHLARVQVFQHLQRHQEAMIAANELVQLEPNQAYYHGVKAFCFLHLNSWTEAERVARDGLSLDPQEGLCLSALSCASAFLGRTEEAVAVGDQALASDPGDDLAHETQGWNELRRGSADKAAAFFSEALRLRPNSITSRQGLSESLMARSRLYRWLMPFFWWLQRISNQRFWFLTFGTYVIAAVCRIAMDLWPSLSVIAKTILATHALVVIVVWLVHRIFRVWLACGRFSKHLLEVEEKPFWRLGGGVLMLVVLLAPLWLPEASVGLLFAGFVGVYVVMPLAATFQPPRQ